jgi:NAD(P)-dependent dehydrogenase (short-subunit alcohol dehydrogenase family)
LAAAGRTVYLADVAELDELATELGAIAAPTDVADPEQMARLATLAADADLVCLNAGIVGTSLGAPWDAPPDEWQKLLEVNLLGVVNGLRAFVPFLLARERPAHILITASLAGLVTFPGGGAYAATKHAVVAVAEQTSLALAGSSVGVTVLCPALVRSGMSETGDDPDDVAAAALAACRQGEFLVVPPEWRAAIVARGILLSTGERPVLPTPAVPQPGAGPGPGES